MNNKLPGYPRKERSPAHQIVSVSAGRDGWFARLNLTRGSGAGRLIVAHDG
jgi:hypothetical protein